jgi:general secretion pathway protein G
MNIYIHKNGQQLGPFDESQISDGIKNGQFTLEDLSWSEGQVEWVPLRILWQIPQTFPPVPQNTSGTNNFLMKQAVVIGITIIICIFIVPNIFNYISAMLMLNSEMSEAKVNRVESDIESIAMQLRTYEMLNYRLPTMEQGLAALSNEPTVEPKPRKWKRLMINMPTDPWGSDYVYQIPSKDGSKAFTLYSLGPDKKESSDDIGK